MVTLADGETETGGRAVRRDGLGETTRPLPPGEVLRRIDYLSAYYARIEPLVEQHSEGVVRDALGHSSCSDAPWVTGRGEQDGPGIVAADTGGVRTRRPGMYAVYDPLPRAGKRDVIAARVTGGVRMSAARAREFRAELEGKLAATADGCISVQFRPDGVKHPRVRRASRAEVVALVEDLTAAIEAAELAG